jgi:hypothetical protein
MRLLFGVFVIIKFVCERNLNNCHGEKPSFFRSLARDLMVVFHSLLLRRLLTDLGAERAGSLRRSTCSSG